MGVSKETIKRGQPLLEGRDWLSSPAKRVVLEAHSHPYLQTMKSKEVQKSNSRSKEEEKKEERYSGGGGL